MSDPRDIVPHEERAARYEPPRRGRRRRTEQPGTLSWWTRLDEMIWAPPDEKGRGIRKFYALAADHAAILKRFIDHDGADSASSLTYSSILTLVPLLALFVSGLSLFGIQGAARDALKAHPLVRKLQIQRVDETAGRPAAVSETDPIIVQIDGETIAETGGEETAPHPGPEPEPVLIVQTQAEPSMLDLEQMMTGEQVVDLIFDAVERASLHQIGPLGTVGLIVAVMLLLARVEVSMNRAWSIHRRRTFGRMLSDYINLLIVGSLILLAMIATTSSQLIDAIHRSLDPINQTALGRAFRGIQDSIPGGAVFAHFVLGNISYVILWSAFIIVYLFIPNTHVRFRSAVAGGVVAGTLYQIAQLFFIMTAGFLWNRYGTIYGAFAVLFVLLFWIYVSWMIVLWGAEVSAAHQNLRHLRRTRRRWKGLPHERETMALRLDALLAGPMLNGDEREPMDEADLADALNCPPDPINEMIELFRANGLLVQSADDRTLWLARSPEQVTALDILRLVREGTVSRKEGADEERLVSAHRSLAEQLDHVRLSDLAHMPIEKIEGLRL